MILTIRTDKPEAELALWSGGTQVATYTWQAHRQLAETIHQKIEELLHKQHKGWSDITGLVCYKGPGSFTGLRIGMSVGNALAYGLGIPIVSTTNEDWQQAGITLLQQGKTENIAVPAYGRPARITQPKK